MRLITVFGKVWDNSHILTENVLLTVYDIPPFLVGQSGYFLIEDKIGVKFFIKEVVE